MTDKRTLKSLAAIDAAGYELLATVGFEQLSVQAWCDAAHITRPTFYGYYLDKNDWLERQIDLAERLLAPALTVAPTELVATMAIAAWPRRAAVRTLLGVHVPKLDLQAQLTAALTQTLQAQLIADPQAAHADTADYRAAAAAASCVHGLTWLLTHGRSAQVEVLQAQTLQVLLTNK